MAPSGYLLTLLVGDEPRGQVQRFTGRGRTSALEKILWEGGIMGMPGVPTHGVSLP